VITAFVLDLQVRKHFAAGSAWRTRLRAAVWAALGVAQIWVLGLRWHHWLAIVDFLKRPLFTVAETEVSVFSILRAIIVIVVAWLVARFLRGWLERSERIGRRVSEGVQYALSSLTFYVIIVAGVLWAMLVGGFPLNALTVLAGMAGIGLGFGLQDVVSNFVAGLILLLERPLAVGDYIEVAGTWGRVQTISLRSTVVRTQDNVHILVPNADIISNQLTNLSHHDRTMRVVIPVGVGYDSDIDHVIEVLVDVAKEHPDVRDFPEPGARLAEFGDSAIVVELLIWISDPSGQVGAEVDLNLDIWRALKREGIEIPFPQRDLHIRADSAPLRLDKDWREMPEDTEE
jgi:small-conductance mechanosensitive channel